MLAVAKVDGAGGTVVGVVVVVVVVMVVVVVRVLLGFMNPGCAQITAHISQFN